VDVDINDGRQVARCPLERVVFVWIEAENHAAARKNHGTPDQVRIFGHQAYSCAPVRGIVFHLLFAVKIVSRIEELSVVARTDELFEFFSA